MRRLTSLCSIKCRFEVWVRRFYQDVLGTNHSSRSHTATLASSFPCCTGNGHGLRIGIHDYWTTVTVHCRNAKAANTSLVPMFYDVVCSSWLTVTVHYTMGAVTAIVHAGCFMLTTSICLRTPSLQKWMSLFRRTRKTVTRGVVIIVIEQRPLRHENQPDLSWKAWVGRVKFFLYIILYAICMGCTVAQKTKRVCTQIK